MSIPVDHHYLPKFYLSRWARDGKVVQFSRPRGVAYPVHWRAVSPRATAKKLGLYSLPELPSSEAQQAIELDVLQPIDDRAAIAFDKLERGIAAGTADRKAFARFLISLLHRTPARLAWIAGELDRRIGTVSSYSEVQRAARMRASALNLMVDLVGSPKMTEVLSSFMAFRIDLAPTEHSLLTSDRPTMLSNGLMKPAGFMMLPIGPRRLAVLTREERVVRSFAEQEPAKLVRAINDAVTRQADALVIGESATQARFVENRLMRSNSALSDHVNAKDGLVRWAAP